VIGFATDGSPIYAPSFLLVDASVGYQRKVWRDKMTMNLQLNVSNLLDNTANQWTNALANGTLWDYQLQNPRLFTLTATLTF
jgi:outer membrane receptor protein involved in Fe transport